MKIAGILLVVLGVLALVYGGFSFAYPDKVVDAGPIELSVTKRESVPISPIIGAIALLGGVGLIVAGRNSDG